MEVKILAKGEVANKVLNIDKGAFVREVCRSFKHYMSSGLPHVKTISAYSSIYLMLSLEGELYCEDEYSIELKIEISTDMESVIDTIYGDVEFNFDVKERKFVVCSTKLDNFASDLKEIEELRDKLENNKKKIKELEADSSKILKEIMGAINGDQIKK